MSDEPARLVQYFTKRVKDLLIVRDQHPSLYQDGTFDFIFVPLGRDPLEWTEKVKAGGTLAGDGPPIEGAAQQGEVWVKCL